MEGAEGPNPKEVFSSCLLLDNLLEFAHVEDSHVLEPHPTMTDIHVYVSLSHTSMQAHEPCDLTLTKKPWLYFGKLS